MAGIATPSIASIAPVSAQGSAVSISIDAAHPAGQTNPNLVGFAFDPRVGQLRSDPNEGFQPLKSRTYRFDVGFQDLVDCPTTNFKAAKLAELQANIDLIQQLGAEPILILTYMAPCLAEDTVPGDPRDRTRLPPQDPNTWQDVVKRLVEAVAPGRVAAGKPPARYFEVWNEPDWVFYQDTEAKFMTNILQPEGQAVAAVAAASGLDLRFGVCGCLFPDPGWLIPMMTVAQQSGIPVGFVSWHYYANYPFIGPDGIEPGFPPQLVPALLLIAKRNPAASPETFVIQVGQVRQWAQAALGRVPELMIDEWNLSAGGFDLRHDTNEGAALQAASLAAFASVNLDRAALYSAIDPQSKDINGNTLPPRYGGWGVIDRFYKRKPVWYAQWMWEQLGATRLDSPQDPVGGTWTAAARSGAGIQVLVSSFLAINALDHDLSLSIGGLDPGSWSAALFRVDSAHAGSMQPAESHAVTVGPDGTAQVTTALPMQSVLLVELTPIATSRSGGSPGQAGSGSASPGGNLPNTSRPLPVGGVVALVALIFAAGLGLGRRRRRRGGSTT